MNEEWVTTQWATRQAERMEADARRLRELAKRLNNPGLLPDEREAETEAWSERITERQHLPPEPCDPPIAAPPKPPDSRSAVSVQLPIFVDGIGPPLEQIEQDYRELVDSTCGGMAQDVLALIAEVKRLRG